MAGVSVNNSQGLEREADRMGQAALRTPTTQRQPLKNGVVPQVVQCTYLTEAQGFFTKHENELKAIKPKFATEKSAWTLSANGTGALGLKH